MILNPEDDETSTMPAKDARTARGTNADRATIITAQRAPDDDACNPLCFVEGTGGILTSPSESESAVTLEITTKQITFRRWVFRCRHHISWGGGY